MKIYNIQSTLGLAAILFITSAIMNVASSNEDEPDLFEKYGENFLPGENLANIFKFTDDKGKITYSSTVPSRFTRVLEMSITEPPPAKSIEEAKKINNLQKSIAGVLNKARDEREASREEKETKRLKKLALIARTVSPAKLQKNNAVVHHRYYYQTEFWGSHPNNNNNNNNKKKKHHQLTNLAEQSMQTSIKRNFPLHR